MNSEVRQIMVYDMIKEHGEVDVSALSDHFEVSPMTMRRVLKKLEEGNLIERSYGKARVIDTSKRETSFDERLVYNQSGKARMAEIALTFLSGGKIKSFYLDGSTSAVALAKAIPKNMSFTIFTNSIPVLEVLKIKPWIKTFAIGGFLDHDSYAFNDLSSEDQCKQIFVDASFTSCGGFSEKGLFNNGFSGTQIRRIIMKNSTTNYLLADNTKFNVQGVFLLNTWEVVDTLITDQPLPEKFLQQLREYGVDCHWDTPV